MPMNDRTDHTTLALDAHCDEELFNRFLGGEDDAYTTLYSRYSARPAVVKRRPSIIELGQAALRARDACMEGVTIVGDVALSASALVQRRAPMRWRDFWVIAQMNSAGAMPIVTLIALLIGIIIAFLGVVVLQRFGAGYYVSYLVGFGVLREMGALMTAIILAGRTGAAFAAELGSMKITEEIDAFTTLGISPLDYLVLPRVLGILVMMPFLVIYADLIGIIGGFAVSALMLDLSLVQFFNGLRSAVGLSDCLLGIAKGFVFGTIIGIAGCMRGLQTGSDASAVGRAATSAVVLGITGIILANAIIDWLAALLNILQRSSRSPRAPASSPTTIRRPSKCADLPCATAIAW